MELFGQCIFLSTILTLCNLQGMKQINFIERAEADLRVSFGSQINYSHICSIECQIQAMNK